jgi:hypothetical protein
MAIQLSLTNTSDILRLQPIAARSLVECCLRVSRFKLLMF